MSRAAPTVGTPIPPLARDVVRGLPGSLIREVANAAMGTEGLRVFWFGEPDDVTPGFIRDAAITALEAGDTFYGHNLGTPGLRQALSDYLCALHQPVPADRIAVTSGGVNALMLACQLLLSPGDRVSAVVPLWPNLTAMPEILGARVDRVPLVMDAQAGRWSLDLDRLLASITSGTRLLLLNSPGNPTGWVASRETLAAILAHCRRTGTWILSDEAYERLVFDAPCAPSMLDLAEPDDRLLVANTFSKAWRMTGWRLGWLVAPQACMADLAKLVEFNTSCAPGFVQQAAVAALRAGEPVVRDFVTELGRRRDTLVNALRAIPRVRLGMPEGAMYAFFRVDGVDDSLALARALIRDAGLGLAPGAAFGPEGEGFLRWCFARTAPELLDGADRLAAFLARTR